MKDFSLNPYCSGQWPRTRISLRLNALEKMSLNPYCSGQWPRTIMATLSIGGGGDVLILIVVDNGLVL